MRTNYFVVKSSLSLTSEKPAKMSFADLATQYGKQFRLYSKSNIYGGTEFLIPTKFMILIS